MTLGQRSASTAPCALGGAHQSALQTRGLISVAPRPLGGLAPAAAAAPRQQRLQRQSASVRAAASAASAASAAGASSSGPVLLWLKRDLRLDDHPGWHQPRDAPGLVPVFCFDPARYAHLVLPCGGAEALCRALAALDRSLRRRGSGLVLRVGRWEEQLPALAAELGASRVLAEQEVESAWCEGVEGVAAALPPGAALHQWTAPLFAAHADDFRELKQQQPAMNEPLPPPAKLPPLTAPVAEAAGDGSAVQGWSAVQLRQLAAEAYRSQLSPLLVSQGYGSASAAAGNTAGASCSNTASGSFSEEEAGGEVIDRLPETSGSSSSGSGSGSSGAGAAAGSTAAWEAELAAEIAAGEGPVLESLGRYLRHLETTAASSGGSSKATVGGGSSDEEEAERQQAALAAAVAAFDLPQTPDGCFPALFGRALQLGVVSKRRVHAEAAAILAQQPEQAWPAGRPLAQLAWLLTSSGGAAARARRQKKAAAAAAAAEAKDFHEQMAAARQGRPAHGGTIHHWRWRGLLTDYLAAEAPAGASDPSRPAILLCHGFGAFGEHYRANVAALAAQGFDVYAPTLPGYGRAEKPVLPYGQGLWRDFLADFVQQVVRRPVMVAGNSIGGFISASMAADYPGLVAGLVLLNSAGPLVEGYAPPVPPAVAKPPPAFVANAVSQGMFAFLEGDVERQLRRVYPVRPDRADSWLGGEIVRAARDPGALGVLRSVFYLPPPHALNYLVAEKFGGPTLVLQGVKDPLINAKQRAQELRRFCPNAEVVELDAGHCPHDEVPDLVNSHLLRFVRDAVMPSMAQRGSSSMSGSGSGGDGGSGVAAAGAAAAAR
ncbi:hypothetical protein ABPG75_009265 [Micractinium tetrahymenae]